MASLLTRAPRLALVVLLALFSFRCSGPSVEAVSALEQKRVAGVLVTLR